MSAEVYHTYTIQYFAADSHLAWWESAAIYCMVYFYRHIGILLQTQWYTLTSGIVLQNPLYIEWKGVKIYDFQKVTFSTLFKLHIAGLGVLIPKRYHRS